MRCFIAVEPPREFVDDVAAMARVLSSAVDGRFMKRNTYHVTLAFLGDLDGMQVSLAMDALDALADDWAEINGGASADIPLACTGLGTFGRPTDATLWLGLDGSLGLNDLAEELREELRARCLPFDDKDFRAHLTLARRARIPKGSLPELAFPLPATATEVTLFKSTLSREGASYKPLCTVTL